jgi:hypothetical protein
MAAKRSKAKERLPERIFAQASPYSIGGVSMFDAGDAINAATVVNFHSEDELMTRAALRLKDAGFEVLQIAETTINIAGSPKLYEDVFGAPIVTEERPSIRENGKEGTSTVLDCHNTDMPGLIGVRGSRLEDVLEGVALEEPVYLDAPQPLPPIADYWHLDVPADVSLGCNGTGRTVAASRAAASRWPWSTPDSTPIHSSPPGATGCPRPSSVRGRAIRATTRSDMGPANPPTSSPARPMFSSCR